MKKKLPPLRAKKRKARRGARVESPPTPQTQALSQEALGELTAAALLKVTSERIYAELIESRRLVSTLDKALALKAVNAFAENDIRLFCSLLEQLPPPQRASHVAGDGEEDPRIAILRMWNAAREAGEITDPQRSLEIAQSQIERRGEQPKVIDPPTGDIKTRAEYDGVPPIQSEPLRGAAAALMGSGPLIDGDGNEIAPAPAAPAYEPRWDGDRGDGQLWEDWMNGGEGFGGFAAINRKAW